MALAVRLGTGKAPKVVIVIAVYVDVTVVVVSVVSVAVIGLIVIIADLMIDPIANQIAGPPRIQQFDKVCGERLRGGR